MKDIQIGSVIQADPVETTHMTNIEVTSSNINEISHIMNKKNRPSDKERDKPPLPSQNPTNRKIQNITVHRWGEHDKKNRLISSYKFSEASVFSENKTFFNSKNH